MKGTQMKSQWRRVRQLVVAGTALTALAVVAACGGGSSNDSASGGTTTGSADAVDAALKAGGEITYWSWTPSAQAQVTAFMKQYPNVKVNYVNAGTGNDHYTKLQNAIKAGSGAPDVAQKSTRRSPSSRCPARSST